MIKKLTPVEQLRELIDEFQLIQLKGAMCGAVEKQVDDIFITILKDSLKNKDTKVPKSVEQWKLQEKGGSVLSGVDVMKISHIMTNLSNKCVDLIRIEYKNKENLFAMGKIVRDFYD